MEIRTFPAPPGTQANASCRNCNAPATEAATTTVKLDQASLNPSEPRNVSRFKVWLLQPPALCSNLARATLGGRRERIAGDHSCECHVWTVQAHCAYHALHSSSKSSLAFLGCNDCLHSGCHACQRLVLA